jgi:hypothetical protein
VISISSIDPGEAIADKKTAIGFDCQHSSLVQAMRILGLIFAEDPQSKILRDTERMIPVRFGQWPSFGWIRGIKGGRPPSSINQGPGAEPRLGKPVNNEAARRRSRDTSVTTDRSPR